MLIETTQDAIKIYSVFTTREELDRKRNNIEFLKLNFYRCMLRPLSTSSVKLQQPDTLIKLKKLQAKFQCEDGKPVWLKGGFGDRILFSTTVVLCVIGTVWSLAIIYELAKPPSWREGGE